MKPISPDRTGKPGRPKGFQSKDIDTFTVLDLFKNYHTQNLSWEELIDKPNPYQQLVGKGYPDVVIHAKLEKFDRKGWLDYGTSIRGAWLTPKGQKAHAELGQLANAVKAAL